MATVLLLRDPSEVRDLAFLLEEEGASVVHWPVLAVSPAAARPSLQALGEQLGRFTWVIPESPTAVRVLAEVVRASGARSASQRATFLAPSLDTVRALGRHGWEARHVLPERAEGRLETLQALLHEDDEVLWVGGPAEPAWREWLGQVPGRSTFVSLYDQAEVPVAPELPDGSIVVVHSPSAAEAFVASTEPGWRGHVHVVASGPTTSAVLAELGIPVGAAAERPTTEALFEATRRVLDSQRPGDAAPTTR
ncbi:MAG: uroporphyrinogen-III synthase [Myxococcaceae bacterium]|nr:uroporphyrinogen-III synthase [Myxococcaceae bacterium]